MNEATRKKKDRKGTSVPSRAPFDSPRPSQLGTSKFPRNEEPVKANDAAALARLHLHALLGQGSYLYREFSIRSSRSNQAKEIFLVSATVDCAGVETWYTLEYDKSSGALVDVWKDGVRMAVLPSPSSYGPGRTGSP